VRIAVRDLPGDASGLETLIGMDTLAAIDTQPQTVRGGSRPYYGQQGHGVVFVTQGQLPRRRARRRALAALANVARGRRLARLMRQR